MGFFDRFLTGKSMDEGVAEYRNTVGAVLLDVRTSEEYESGHVMGSTNIPLGEIDRVKKEIPDRNTPLFVYCRSGARSGRAVDLLKRTGYRNAKNIGGMMYFHGEVVGQ